MVGWRKGLTRHVGVWAPINRGREGEERSENKAREREGDYLEGV